MKKRTRQIVLNIRPTWAQAMSVYILALTKGNEAGKKEAAEALMLLAEQLDKRKK
jgi:hypothetical protein